MSQFSIIKTLEVFGKKDTFYVLLKDEYTVADFEDHIPLILKNHKNYDIEYIGGQNKALIVICKESFLHFLFSVIHSYARIPLLARIQPSLLRSACAAYNDLTALSITAQFYEDASVSLESFSTLKKSSLSIERYDELSSLLTDFPCSSLDSDAPSS